MSAASNLVEFDVGVPEQAKIFVNDRPTTLKGTDRYFFFSRAVPGKEYKFRVRAELRQGGEILRRAQTLYLRAGDRPRITFQFPELTKSSVQAETDFSAVLRTGDFVQQGETLFWDRKQRVHWWWDQENEKWMWYNQRMRQWTSGKSRFGPIVPRKGVPGAPKPPHPPIEEVPVASAPAEKEFGKISDERSEKTDPLKESDFLEFSRKEPVSRMPNLEVKEPFRELEELQEKTQLGSTEFQEQPKFPEEGEWMKATKGSGNFELNLPKTKDLFGMWEEETRQSHVAPGGLSSNQLKIWVDNTGKNKCKGRLVAIDEETVQILKDDDQVITVAIDRLSEQDRIFVERNRAAKKFVGSMPRGHF